MEFTTDNVQRKLINPVWSNGAPLYQSSQFNKWPMRQHGHCKRIYGNGKLRSNIGYGNDNNEIFQVAIKVDSDELEKHRSNLSSAFCSTSKVKYFPLPGSSHDPFAGLKLGTNHPFTSPILSRPVSRPVLLHWKRYTVVASGIDRENTSFSHLNYDDKWNSSKSDRIMNEQRKRFSEIEQNKFNGKSHGMVRESSQMQLRNNYCLSGHQMKIGSSKATIAERLAKLQPIFNLQNRSTVSRKSHERRQYSTVSRDLVDGPNSLEDPMLSPVANSNSVASADIVEKVCNTNVFDIEEVIQSIQKIILGCQSTIIEEEKIFNSKEWVKDLVINQVEEFSKYSEETSFDSSDIDTLWDSLTAVQPTNKLASNEKPLHSEETNQIFRSSELESIEVSSLVNMWFPDEQDIQKRYLWSKIFTDLSIENVSESLFCQLLRLRSNWHFMNGENVVGETNRSLMNLSFWIFLFKELFQATTLGIEEWLRTSTAIVFNNSATTEELRTDYEDQLKKFISDNFTKGESTLSILEWLQAVPWLLETHLKLFHHPFSIDEIATTRCLIPHINDD